MRRRAAWLSVFGLIAALVWAVQRDTFVRRRLVPRPSAAADAMLARPYPGTPSAVATLDQAVADVSFRGGVPVVLADPAGLEQVGVDVAAPRLWDLRPTTVGDALTEVCMSGGAPSVALGFVARDGGVYVGTDDALPTGHIARAYDLSALIRAEQDRHAAGVVSDRYAAEWRAAERRAAEADEERGAGEGHPADEKAVADGAGAVGPGATGLSPAPATRPYWSQGQLPREPFSDAAVVEVVGRLARRTLRAYAGGPARAGGPPAGGGAVRTVGSRLVVVHTEMNHRRVAATIEDVRRNGFSPESSCIGD